MLSKNKIKLINSLATKKYRYKNRLFVAESPKLVSDLTKSDLTIVEIFCTEKFQSAFADFNPILVSPAELKKISFLQHPQGVLALIKIPENKFTEINDLTLALDNIQDPGNLGTIIRIAHWYGIKNIVCSEGTVDLYNPKTIQSSMAAFAFTNIIYTPLKEYLKKLQKPVYGALMTGKNVYKQSLSSDAVLVVGNEGNGISSELLPFITHPLSIPDFPEGEAIIDSLNVSMATAILCSEFRRRLF